MPDKVGQQFGSYRLIRLLGKGGFAEVYLGQHVRVASKQAAVKILYLFDVNAKKFHQEAEITEKLVHPHIVRLLDFDLQEGIPFLVLDYAPGGSLRNRHPKGTHIPLETVVSYLKEIAPALQYAHNLHILHRDIKPDNMLIGRQGELLLSDFGIAELSLTGRTSIEASFLTGGTPYYMAPEAFTSKPEKASDQYALAISVYEWLCGTYPFLGDNFIQLGYQHTHGEVPPLRSKNPAVLPAVEHVVMQALAKNPKDRFPEVMDFAMDLVNASVAQHEAPPKEEPAPGSTVPPGAPPVATETHKDTPPGAEQTPPQPEATPAPETTAPKTPHLEPTTPAVQAQPPDTIGTIPHRRLSRRRALQLGAGTTVAVTGIGGILYWLEHATPPPGTTLVTYHGHTGPVESVAWSPNGKLIASGSSDKTVQVWDAANGDNMFINHGHTYIVWSVAWSPNGKLIASGSEDSTIQLLDSTNGHNVFTFNGQSGSVNTVAWSPDGKRIASGNGAANTVQVWDISTGGNVFTYRGHSYIVNTVAWSPDGKRIASGSYDRTVQVWDAATGGNVFTYRGHSNSVNFMPWSVAWSPDGKRIASGSNDSTVQVWDATNGGNVFTYHGHTGPVESVAWSPDGKRIASGSSTVQVWDATNGGNVFTYRGHSSWVNSVAWSPDGRQIASGGGDKTVQVWQSP